MKIKLGNAMFYIPWFILVSNTVIAQSYLADYSNSIFTLLAILILLFRIAYIGKIRAKEFLWMSLFFITGLIISIITKDNRMLWLAITISASINVDFFKVAKYTFWILLIEYILIICSCVILYGNIGRSLKGGLALGMGHPNILHAMLVVIIVLYIYINWDSIKIWHIAIMEGINFILFKFSMSRTGMLCLSVVLILVFLFLLSPTKKMLRKIIIITFMAAIFFTILPFVYYIMPNNKYLVFLDEKMTGRLWQSCWYMKISGIKLFGNYYSELYTDRPYALLDMGFFRLLLEYGVIAYTLIMLGYLFVIKKAVKDENQGLIFLCLAMMIFSCTESLGTYVFYNIAFLSFGTLVFRKNDQMVKNHIVLNKRRLKKLKKINSRNFACHLLKNSK